jgi:hypothetical protein
VGYMEDKEKISARMLPHKHQLGNIAAPIKKWHMSHLLGHVPLQAIRLRCLFRT